MAKERMPNAGRGRIVELELQKAITFNGIKVSKAIIEIDHINYGINKKTNELKKDKRTNFMVMDVVEFLMLIDGEDMVAKKYKGRISQFSMRINCPVFWKFYGREFNMIFYTHYDRQDEIHIITMFPGW